MIAVFGFLNWSTDDDAQLVCELLVHHVAGS
jgi:hypothetical protein